MQNISGNQKNNKIQTSREYFCSHILFEHLILITCSLTSLKSWMKWPHRMKKWRQISCNQVILYLFHHCVAELWSVQLMYLLLYHKQTGGALLFSQYVQEIAHSKTKVNDGCVLLPKEKLLWKKEKPTSVTFIHLHLFHHKYILYPCTNPRVFFHNMLTWWTPP